MSFVLSIDSSILRLSGLEFDFFSLKLKIEQVGDLTTTHLLTRLHTTHFPAIFASAGKNVGPQKSL